MLQCRLALISLVLALGACDCNPSATRDERSCQFHSDCPKGQECHPERKVCVTAFSRYCDTDADCEVYGDEFTCEEEVHTCISPNECDDSTPCPDGMECQVDASSGYRVCVYPGCDDDAACAAELVGQCQPGTQPRCVLRACVCQDLCGAPCGEGKVCCAQSGGVTCIETPRHCSAVGCQPGWGAVAIQESPWSAEACGYEGEQCRCEEMPALPVGDVGDPSVLQLDASGVPIVAAYNRGVVEHPFWGSVTYGDLMLGQVDAAGGVAWSFVDGVPADEAPEGGPSGPRGGVIAEGDDVGAAVDLVVDTSGRLHFAYWDRTASALRYARRELDGQLAVATVDAEGDSGRFPSLALDPISQRPRISYFVRRLEAAGSAPEAQLRVAVGLPETTPAGLPTFRVHVAARLNLSTVPCEGGCPEDLLCQDAPEDEIDFCVREEEPATCSAACGDGNACVAGSCVPVLEPLLYEPLPAGIGIDSRIVVLADGAPVVVAYDSVRGDLVAVTLVEGTELEGEGAVFQLTRVDGQFPLEAQEDVGRHLAAILGPQDTVHLSYVDLSTGDVVYAQLPPDLVLRARQVLDDGRRLGPMGSMADHLLADPALVLAPDGRRSVVYQDATVHALYRCDAAPGQAFDRCQWVLGGESGAGYHGSYGFSTSAVWNPATGQPLISTYRFVPVGEQLYDNGLVILGLGSEPACRDDAYEPNDARSNAAALDTAAAPGRLCPGDEDWFALPLERGQTVHVRLALWHAAGNIDLALHGPGGEARMISESLSDLEELRYSVEQAGVYALRVYATAAITSTYWLAVDVEATR